MTITDRVKAAAAAFRGKSATTTTTDDQLTLSALLDWLGIHKGLTGEALSEATYFACLKVLSESVGKLPLKIQQQTPDSGIHTAREHPYYRMLNERPNRYMTASTFWGAVEMCRNHYGNAYAWIDTRDRQRPQLWLMPPDKVQVYYDNARVLGNSPDLYYQYSTPEGVWVLGSEDVLHFKSHLTFDGVVGVSVVEQLAGPIQGSLKAQTMQNQLYDSGMTAKSVLQYTGGLNDQNVQALVKGITAHLQTTNGGVSSTIPLPVGFTLTPLNIKLADSQFAELKQYGALQIAAAFGVKPYQVGDYTKSSYASAEAQQLSFLVDTLLYIVKQYEEEISYKLLTAKEEAAGYHTKFNTAVLLRTEHRSQVETLSTAVSNFIYTPNEAREFLDKPAKPGGDVLLGNGASIPVHLAGIQYQTPQPAAEPEGEPETEPEEPATDDDTGEEETE